MTTKKFIVSERVNNEWRSLGGFDDRKTALNGIATYLNSHEDADPQNFKIEVEEVESKSRAELLAEGLAAKLEKYGDGWVITQREDRAYIARTCKMWTSAVLQDIIEFMEQGEYAGCNYYINSEGVLVVYTEQC